MKSSQKVLLGTLGVALVLTVGAVVTARLVAGHLQSDGTTANSASASSTQTRFDTRGFTGIDARGVWEITIERGDTWSVEVTHPENRADDLDVRVEGDALVLGHGTNSGFRLFGGSEHYAAHVVMPELSSVDLSGASNLRFSGFSGSALRLISSGASKIAGDDSRYDSLELVVSGAGSVDLQDMPVVDAKVVLSGAAEIELNMDGGALTGTASGAGKIRYRGSVRSQQLTTSGFTSVEQIG